MLKTPPCGSLPSVRCSRHRVGLSLQKLRAGLPCGSWRDRPEKSAALEYAPRGVRINPICPGIIETPLVADMLKTQKAAMDEFPNQQLISFLGTAEEMAQTVLCLCSPGASFVVGVALPVDDGFTAH